MNKDQLQKELLDTIGEGANPSDIAKKKGTGGGRKEKWDHPPTKEEIEEARKKKQEQVQKPKGSVPPPPPPPPMPGANNPELLKRMTALEDKLDRTLKRLENSEKVWSQTAQNYLQSLQKSMAVNDRLESMIEEWMKTPVKLSRETEQAFQETHQIIRDLKEENKKLKLGYSEEQHTPRKITIPIFMTERDKQIIEQAQAHLEPLVNTTTLRERILKAEAENTKEAYWDLHKDLTSAGTYLTKLIQFYQDETDEVHAFTNTLGAILHGEHLDKIENK